MLVDLVSHLSSNPYYEGFPDFGPSLSLLFFSYKLLFFLVLSLCTKNILYLYKNISKCLPSFTIEFFFNPGMVEHHSLNQVQSRKKNL